MSYSLTRGDNLKKKYLLFGFGFLIVFSAFFVIKRVTANNSLPSELKSSAVFATMPRGGVIFDSIDGKAVDLAVSGSKVEIIKDRGGIWYYIKHKNHMGWVKAEVLNIPEDPPTNTQELTNEFIINYGNKNLSSNTKHFVWVDIDRQKVYVLKGKKGQWELERTILCATGKNSSPTIRGNFKIGDRGNWFYSERLGSGAVYWVRFCDSYLFHSVAMDKDKNIVDGTLGKRHSSGCVRMSVENAKWFLENIEMGSSVWIY